MKGQEVIPHPDMEKQDQAHCGQIEKICEAAEPTSSTETLANHESEASSTSTEAKSLPAWRVTVVSIALMIGFFLALLDTTIVATAIYSISIEFGSLSSTFWVVLAYTLGYVSFASVFARISDFTGRRAAITFAFVLFIATSLGCGWSKNLNGLIAARALQGVSGAGLFALALTVIIEINPPERRGHISGVVGITIAVSGACGPLIGGAFSQHVTWRWVFWLNGPLALAGLILFIIGWCEQFDSQNDRRPWKEFDWIGTLLLMAASILVVLGLQQPAENQVAWNSAQTIATLTVGCACWVMLVAHQFLIRKSNLAAAFPFIFLRNRALTAGYVATLLVGFTATAATYIIPLRFQLVNEESPSGAGIKLLPLLVSSAVGSFVAGSASSKRNNAFATFTIATSLILIGEGLFTTLDGNQHPSARNYGFQVILGFGLGMTASTMSIMGSVESAPADRAVAQGIGGQMRILGSSIGIAAFNGVLAHQLAHGLAGELPPAAIAAITSDVAAVQQLGLEQQSLVRANYSDAFVQTFRISTYVAAFGLVAALLTWQKDPPHFLKTVSKAGEGDKEARAGFNSNIKLRLSAKDDPEADWGSEVMRA